MSDAPPQSGFESKLRQALEPCVDLAALHVRTANSLVRTVTVTYYAIPAQPNPCRANYRILMFVQHAGGKAKLTLGDLSGWPTSLPRPRAKTASPERVADYIATLINRAASAL